ncbi:MAG: hypothetical protein Q7J98_06225 [Kiritimatiellia bacterium]|nr:hypothetical protein [Kiritimatiellia bacterium]
MTKILNLKHSAKNRENPAFGSFEFSLPAYARLPKLGQGAPARELGQGICFEFRASIFEFESLRPFRVSSDY